MNATFLHGLVVAFGVIFTGFATAYYRSKPSPLDHKLMIVGLFFSILTGLLGVEFQQFRVQEQIRVAARARALADTSVQVAARARAVADTIATAAGRLSGRVDSIVAHPARPTPSQVDSLHDLLGEVRRLVASLPSAHIS